MKYVIPYINYNYIQIENIHVHVLINDGWMFNIITYIILTIKELPVTFINCPIFSKLSTMGKFYFYSQKNKTFLECVKENIQRKKWLSFVSHPHFFLNPWKLAYFCMFHISRVDMLKTGVEQFIAEARYSRKVQEHCDKKCWCFLYHSGQEVSSEGSVVRFYLWIVPGESDLWIWPGASAEV